MYDCILFDFDGTVFDTVEGISKSVQYALEKFGIVEEPEALRCFAGPPLLAMFQEKYGFTPEAAQQATDYFRERYRPIGIHESRPFPGIKELLEALRAAGRKTGIATTKPQILAEQLLTESGLIAYFDVICGSGADGNSPKWQLAERAMKALGASRESTVLVGDTKYDAIGAEQCGIGFIGAGYGYAAQGELEAAGAERIIESVEDLKKALIG